MLAVLLMPFEYPIWLDDLLRRLGATLVPIALVSVGYQLHLSHVRGKMQLNRYERAIMCLLRDYPGQLFGPQDFMDKILVEAAGRPMSINIRQIERALKKLHRIGFISTETRQ